MSEARWALLRDYPSIVEAEFDQGRLEESGIPVLVKGPATGIFGPGFSGASPLGVELYVPGERLEDARELLQPGDEE